MAAGWLAGSRPALAASGPVLDAPAVIQAGAAVPVSLTYAARRCGGDVLFTWDSLSWATAAPTGGGFGACTAAISAPPPSGTANGAHQVCGVGPAGSACRTLTVVAAPSPTPAPATSPAGPPRATAAPRPTPTPTATEVLAVASPGPSPGVQPSPARAVLATPLPVRTAPPVAGISVAVLLVVAAAAACALLLRSLLGTTQP